MLNEFAIPGLRPQSHRPTDQLICRFLPRKLYLENFYFLGKNMYPPIGWQVVAGGSSLSGENWAQNRWQIKNIFGFVIDASRLMQHSQTTLQAVVKL